MASNPVQERLGFRVDVHRDGAAGTVIWNNPDPKEAAVRPATLVEVRLWQIVEALVAATDTDRGDPE
jgi:hypothetical protein